MKKVGILLSLLVSMMIVGCNGTTVESSSSQSVSELTESSSVSSTAIGEITWSGLDEQTVVRGDEIDLLAGITAMDSVDGDITDKIVVKDDGGFSSEYVGGYTVVYEVKNTTGITSTFEKDFGVTVEHNVFNGEFVADLGWTFDIPGGAGSKKVINEEMVITIKDPGTAWWSVQFYQLNSYFVKDVTYHLTFQARSPQGHSISAGFEEVNNNNRMMQGGVQVMKLTEEMQTYSLYYTSTVNCSNVKTVLYVGWQLPTDNASVDNPHTIIIDNINVAKVEMASEADQPTLRGVGSTTIISGNHSFDTLEGVKAFDKDSSAIEFEAVGVIPTNVRSGSNYIVSYRATDSNGNFKFVNRFVIFTLPISYPYELVNGSFNDGYTGWTREINQVEGTGKATYSENLADGTVSVHVTNVSNAEHHIQIFQQSPKFVENQSYQIIITLKSNVARKVKIEVTDPDSDYLDIATSITPSIGTEYQTFTIDVTAKQNYAKVKVALLLGNLDGNQPLESIVTIDDFKIVKK